MEASVEIFAERLRQPWLTCEATQAAIAGTFHWLVGTLQNLPEETFFVIAANEPEATLAAVLAAFASNHCAVLGNPQWTPAEVQAAQSLLGGKQLWFGGAGSDAQRTKTRAASAPTVSDNAERLNAGANTAQTSLRPYPQTGGLDVGDLVVDYKEGDRPAPLSAASLRGYLLVPTGGTGGRLKLACHNWHTLCAAIDGYARFWNTQKLNAVCALPVCHIGGLMPALRTFVTGGRLCLLPWHRLRALALAEPAPEAQAITSGQNDGANAAEISASKPDDTADNEGNCGVAAGSAFGDGENDSTGAPDEGKSSLPRLNAIAELWQISLVPAQVQQLLECPVAVRWLRAFQAVLIGGGASNTAMLQAAAASSIPLCPAYGMTETAATIALQRPEDFLRIYREPNPDAVPEGEVLPHLEASIEEGSGRILLRGKSLLHGYFPAEPQRLAIYPTGDRGRLRGRQPQYLSVLGRLDRIIVSGGKKIDPGLIEQCIREQAQALGIGMRAALAAGVADEKWGQRLVVFIEMGAPLGLAVPAALCERVAQELAPFQVPKQWIGVSALPLDDRGKPDHVRIASLAMDALAGVGRKRFDLE